MAWPKIKNIIILILLGTNLCLLGFTASRQLRSYQLQEKARSDAISFLQEKGLQVEEEQVPKSTGLMPQYVKRNVEKEAALAAALLAGEVTVQERGAEVYRYYNENGVVQFHSSGEFSAQFSAGTMAVGEESLREYASGILHRLNFQGSFVSQAEDGQKQSLTYQESWNGIPLLNCQVELTFEQGSLTSMTGRRLAGEPERDSSSSPISVATALMKFYNGQQGSLGDVCSQISGIIQAYTVTSIVSEPMLLVPVWYITTDTGAYQLDMLTGELSRTT